MVAHWDIRRCGGVSSERSCFRALRKGEVISFVSDRGAHAHGQGARRPIGRGLGSLLPGVLSGHVGVVVEWMGNRDPGLGIFVEREVSSVWNERSGPVMARLTLKFRGSSAYPGISPRPDKGAGGSEASTPVTVSCLRNDGISMAIGLLLLLELPWGVSTDGPATWAEKRASELISIQAK